MNSIRQRNVLKTDNIERAGRQVVKDSARFFKAEKTLQLMYKFVNLFL